MNPSLLQPPLSPHPPAPGGRPGCLVVDIGLSCPSCRVQLTLPSAYLGQVVTGPCPVCGWTLVFCHGRIESAPVPAAVGPLIEAPEPDRLAGVPRPKLSRSGTMGVQYLDELQPADGGESAWGAEGARVEAAAAGEPAAPVVRRHRWWWAAGAVTVMLVTAMTWQLSRPAPPLPAPQPAAPGDGRGPRAIPAGWGEAALAAWQAFARAGTVEEKLAHVLDAERVAPALRAAFAAQPEADAVWAARSFQPLPGTPDDRRRGMMALGFSPTAPGERPMILFLRTTPPAMDGSGSAGAVPEFRLDWETYIQERDGLAEAFCNDPAAPRRTFRLAVERVHVFDEPGAKREHGESFGLRLRTPSGLPLPRVAELRAGSPLEARLDEQLRWGMTAYATLQLAWETEPGQPPRVVVSDFVCWHFPGLGGVPEFEADLTPLPPQGKDEG